MATLLNLNYVTDIAFVFFRNFQKSFISRKTLEAYFGLYQMFTLIVLI